MHPIAAQILKAQGRQQGLVFTDIPKDLNTHLKCIALTCGLRGKLTSHMARHSFGTLSLSAGIPLESIVKMMGHKSVKSTQVYARVTDQKISEEIDRVVKQQEKAL